jgi:signal transduction histidine kinase
VPSFIIDHLDEIVAEWESFATTVSPASATMDPSALRDHAKQMLQAIAKDIETWQSARQRDLKSKGLGPVLTEVETAAETHGSLRHMAGFDLTEVVAEFRALRATVIRLWVTKEKYGDADTAYEMVRFNEALDQALAESVATYSEELARSRDTFLAILGHDLRSPLGAVSGALQLLAAPGDAARQAETLAAGMRSVSAMSGMIRDLLEYTRSRLGKGIPTAPSEGDLEATCKEAMNEIALVHPQSAFRFESGGNLAGVFDSERMHQVISNLLNNAVQHGKRGSPVLLIASGDNYNLTLKVKNQGLPIAPELLQVIFDPLVQIPAEEPGSYRVTNLGLGLYIAREIVLAHRGTIHAESSAAGGTIFTVELPCAIHAPADAVEVKKPRSSAVGD